MQNPNIIIHETYICIGNQEVDWLPTFKLLRLVLRWNNHVDYLKREGRASRPGLFSFFVAGCETIRYDTDT